MSGTATGAGGAGGTAGVPGAGGAGAAGGASGAAGGAAGAGGCAAWTSCTAAIGAARPMQVKAAIRAGPSRRLRSRNTRRTITSFGLSQDTNLAYRQDVFGLQLGVDFGGKALGFGLTGGYATSVQNFDASADRSNVDAWNIGAYTAFNSGRFFANALAKYDRYKVRLTIGSTGEKARSTGDGYGGQVEAGVRFGSDRFFAEPLVSLSWQHIALDPVALSATIGFDDREGGRAAAGLRIGGLRDIGPARAAFYAQGDYVRPFDGSDGISVTTGSTTVLIGDTRFESYGKGRIGMSITRGQVSGFIEGNGRVGRDYHSGGGRVGLRIGF